MTRMSLEEFADITGRNVSLRDFKGMRVQAVGNVEMYDDEAPVWTIQFEGFGRIHNYDPTISAPTHIVGAALDMIILGAHDPLSGAARTEIRFGLNAVYLNPLEHSMQHPTITDDKIVFDQRSRANI